MPVVVKVVTKEEYAAWLAERKAATNPSAAPAPAAEEAAPTVAALPTAPQG
jgi:heme/copper-type cytochrome/quinol oxidase subunit 2